MAQNAGGGRFSRLVAKAVSSVAEHAPPMPHGTPLEPWGKPTEILNVVGESHHQGAFRTLFHGRPGEFEGSAALVPDPGNPHDRQAVAVRVDGLHVGNLDRQNAAQWHQQLTYLAQYGRHLVVPVRVWYGQMYDGTPSGSVSVTVPPTDQLVPVNRMPDAAHVVLPRGGNIQVTKEDEHMDVLVPWATGTDRAIAVTLHAVQEARARSTVELVEVRLDDKRVGVLSPALSAAMLPLVEHVTERHLVPVARAILKGNRLKADVILQVAKTQDVDVRWLDSLG